MLVAKQLRAAPWSVKRLLNYILSYKFLQDNVVQPAFHIKAQKLTTLDEIRRYISDRYAAVPVLPQSLPNITVDLTQHVLTYATWLATDNNSYGPIINVMSNMFDKAIGFQPHRVDSNNRIEFMPVVSKPSGPRRSAAAEETPLRINLGFSSPQRTLASAGAAARAMTSPSKPGQPKAPRYVDVSRPVVSGVNPGAAAAAAAGVPPAGAPGAHGAVPQPPSGPYPYGYPPYPPYPFPGYPSYPYPGHGPTQH
jgi:hypothetical protein